MKLDKLLILASIILIIISLTSRSSERGVHDITNTLGFTHHKEDADVKLQKERYKEFHQAQKDHPPCGSTYDGVLFKKRSSCRHRVKEVKNER